MSDFFISDGSTRELFALAGCSGEGGSRVRMPMLVIALLLMSSTLLVSSVGAAERARPIRIGDATISAAICLE